MEIRIMSPEAERSLNEAVLDEGSSAAQVTNVANGVGQAAEAADNAYYLNRQARFESNARSYPHRLPVALKRAEGVYVEDVTGKSYLDCLSGAGALALGHYHPVVVEAIQQTWIDRVPFQTLDLTTPVKDRFVEELFSTLPKEFADQARIQFCGPSGADAIEAALKLVKTTTGRRSILAFQGAYHGMTHGSLGLMGHISPKVAVSGLMPEVHFLPFPYGYRCPFGVGGPEGAQAAAEYVERVLDDDHSGIAPPAALILEVVQGEGGVIPAPDTWLRAIRRLTRERDIPLIIDEVQTGIGRTGRMYAFEQAGILPDVLVLSKAIGGGLPLSVVVYHQDLDVWQPGAHAGTFRGNQMAMAAGAATLRFVKENALDRHAAAMGERLRGHLRLLQQDLPCLGDVRGRGLMVGVEVVDSNGKPDSLGVYPPSGALARRIQAECLTRGLLLETGGRQGSVVRFMPPLIVTATEVDRIALIFHGAVAAVSARRG